MVKRKLPSKSGSSLEAVEYHPEKGAIKFFCFFLPKIKLMQLIYNYFPGIQKLVKVSNIDFPYSVKLILFATYF